MKSLLDSFDSLITTVLMGVLVYSMARFQLPVYVIFPIQVIVGIVAYYFLNKFFDNKALPYCLSLVKGARKKK